MKKTFAIMVLALQFVGAVGLASTVAPFPECLPCKADLQVVQVAPFPECLPCKADVQVVPVVQVAPFPECLPCKADLR